MRVGAAASFAAVSIDATIRSGATPRDDGFFDDGAGGERPDAEEILEGVLIKARDAYEEKKVPLLGTLYAWIAFHEEISSSYANQLLGLATRLTYRQLVILAVASDEAGRAHLRQSSYRNDLTAIEHLGIEGQGLITEIYDLYQQGLLSDAGGSAWISLPDVTPGQMRVQGAGSMLAQGMKLRDSVREVDQAAVRERLTS